METNEPAEPAPPASRGLARKLGYGALAVVVLLILLAEFTGALSRHQPAKPAAAASHSASPSPRASPAPTLAPGPQQKFEAWHDGAGGEVFQAFRQGLGRFNADTQAGDQPAVEAEGAALAQDAAAAARHPPPVAARAYTRAMSAFVNAGRAAQDGDFTGSAAWLNQATRYERAAARAWNALAART